MSKPDRQRATHVVPSFLSPFDMAPSGRGYGPEVGTATPVIVDYWRLVVRERRKLLAPVLVTALAALVIGLRTTPIFEATSTLMFESTKGPVSIQEVGGGIANVPVEEGLAEFLQTSDVALRVIRNLNLTARPEFVASSGGLRNLLPGAAAEWLSKTPPPGTSDLEQRALGYFHKNLKVVRTHQSPLVQISFQSQDPQLAAAIVNEVPTAFIRADMDARYAATREADQWLNDRLAQLKAGLDRSEKALANYRNENGIVARGSDEGSDRQISFLNQRLIDARARLGAAEEAYKQANSTNFNEVMGAPGIANNPGVARAREAQSVAQARMAEVRSQLGDAHPQYRRASSELQQAREDLQEQIATAKREIGGELASARANEKQLVASLENARQALKDLDSKEIVARQLEQEVSTNRQLYQTFLARVKEVTAAGDFQRPAARLIDAAQVPSIPVKPQKLLMTLMGAILGLLVGFFAIVLIDQIRNTLRRTDDVEGKLGRPLLSAIPKLDGNNAVKAARMQIVQPDSLFAEAIRTLATTVTLAGLEQDMNVIAISSAMDGEGKTSVACNLATALSATRRVLLIDCDLRRPAVFSSLGMPVGTPGLVQLLTDRASLNQCLKTVPGTSLKVIGAGRSVSNALDLLMNFEFDELIADLQRDFDTVIIDCPPVQLVSDTLILGRSASSMIFVARSDSTSLQVIRRALHRIDKAGISILGVALNAHDFAQADRFYGENSGYARYGYRQSYGAADAKNGRRRKTVVKHGTQRKSAST
ncbi:MAG: polysaccharide biosynthesis tyrosine autokinase [Lautropia sp.]|nr:polysaccharide biosynthesis tyrosine autokinase [Lautropia sp.]